MINFKSYLNEEIIYEKLFDVIEDYVTDLSIRDEVDPEMVWEYFEDYDDDKLYSLAEDWQDSKYKNPEGGLTKSGVMAYRREHPGSKLQTAVTTKPSKLKAGSKAANRRKSFCARMGGMKKRLTSAKTAHDPDSRINKALRKWHC
jgi:Domain of unknown function (DUF6321)